MKYTPKKVGYKGIKWKAKNSKIVYVAPNGTVTPIKKGSTRIIGRTKDGTNKKVVIKVKVKAAPTTATATPYLEKDSREETLVEDFESYSVGTTWKVGTAGGYSNSGTMTVVEDPEDSSNKVLKVDYTGSDQAYDFAPVFNIDLDNLNTSDKAKAKGTTLGDYNAIRFDSRVISNNADCNYKTVYTYFDTYGSMSSSDYFATSNYDGAYGKDAPKTEYRFGVGSSMATGVDKTYNVPTELQSGLAIQNESIISASAMKKYNNKVFPTYYSDYADGTDKGAISPGYSEEETSSSNKVSFQQNTLEFQSNAIENAMLTGSDTSTPLLERSKFDMVFGSTYTGSQGRSWSEYHMVMYIDNIRLMSGDIAITSVELSGADSIACGETATLKTTLTPSNTTQTAFNWTSSDTSLATVDENGIVTANSDGKEGTVTITCTNKANTAIKATKTIKIYVPVAASGNYDILNSSFVSVVPTEEKGGSTKVHSDVDASISNGKLVTSWTGVNQAILLDLGKETDLSGYKGLEVTGLCSSQMIVDFYDSTLDQTVTKNDGYDEDWYALHQGVTYPFFQGSCSTRLEGGEFNNFTASMYNNKHYIATEEKQYYSLSTLGSGNGGDWTKIRYIRICINKVPEKWVEGTSSTKLSYTFYNITGLRLLTSDSSNSNYVDTFESIDSSDSSHYTVFTNSENQDTSYEDGTVGYYVDNVSSTNALENRNTNRDLSSSYVKYVRVKVTGASTIDLGIKTSDGTNKTLYTSTSTETGERYVYFNLKDLDDADLSKVDEITVKTDAGAVDKIQIVTGEVGYTSGLTKYIVTDGAEALVESASYATTADVG